MVNGCNMRDVCWDHASLESCMARCTEHHTRPTLQSDSPLSLFYAPSGNGTNLRPIRRGGFVANKAGALAASLPFFPTSLRGSWLDFRCGRWVRCPFFVSALWHCNPTCNVSCSANSHKVKFSRSISCKPSQFWLLYSRVVQAPSVCSIPPQALSVRRHSYSTAQLQQVTTCLFAQTCQ